MSMVGSQRRVAAGVVLALSLAGLGTAGTAATAGASQQPGGDLAGVLARLGERTRELGPVTSAAATPAEVHAALTFCATSTLQDPDEGNVIDATAAALNVDCDGGHLVEGIALDDPTTVAGDVLVASLAVDTDGDVSNGCEGMDHGWSLMGNGEGALVGWAFAILSCDDVDPTPIAPVEGAVEAGTVIAFVPATTFGTLPPTVRWSAGFQSTRDDTLDVVPDEGAGELSVPRAAMVTPRPSWCPAGDGYWLLGAAGEVHAFGFAPSLGSTPVLPGADEAVDVAGTVTGCGYWAADAEGHLYPFGDAQPYEGVTSLLAPGEAVTSIAATPSGGGLWVFTTLGRVLTRGDAGHFGDLAQVTLNGPVLQGSATPSGDGYWMVGSDGGVFTFGDAGFFGSTGGVHLNRPVMGIVPTPSRQGYWLVADDGGVFAFGDAAFLGSMGGTTLAQPVVGMIGYHDGYLMVARDGGVFDFSSHPFLGSLGGRPIPSPIVAIAARH
jgi:hypothetical protein